MIRQAMRDDRMGRRLRFAATLLLVSALLAPMARADDGGAAGCGGAGRAGYRAARHARFRAVELDHRQLRVRRVGQHHRHRDTILRVRHSRTARGCDAGPP